ncbi:1,2-phenylacetyl-CoA epoxidase subunit PaaE [Bailinhaonella thermotolerans]|uniref:Phenylacetate-CoA oxygenase/reductase subunit PaaK n=1 Tax=Bailinhaonella thermotolerans TaxID=1070861 RepID=A0A3A4BGZ6_9ACTN|nr:1,2-phenylacetyl-CoA epoxidase subunit PaaE [Bailinhaonella thermotolerans]RJL34032.1 phenylacetate-CoA oxygenase/reductase subunit PaaK [Bailinhaonella thermotolerans]
MEADGAAVPRARRTRPRFHPLRVAGVERLCEDAVAVTFDVPAELAPAYSFAPGQTLTLRRELDGRDERRSYSICAPAGAAPRIGVREVPGGLFSSWLVRQVRPGDEVEVMTPAGSFTPELGTPEHHVLVAAGSGVTPMISIAASVLAAHEAARVTLFYGNRRTDTVMFADELADLKDRHPGRFQLAHVLSREPRDAAVLSGRLDGERFALLAGALLDVGGVDHWWLCGPEGMVRGVREVLDGLGVPPERIHRELFHAGEEPPAPVRGPEPGAEGASARATVVLDGRATVCALPYDRSVLEGAQASRPDLPFACKGGVCGTCRARVTSGAVDLRRNFALEQPELAAGYVLTCQSYPTTPELTLDYDA